MIDSNNALYVADYSYNRIQKFSSGSTIGMTIAGQPSGTAGSNASFLRNPSAILFDSSGNLYVSDMNNHRVQFFSNGSMTGTTIAGTGKEMRV